jgi:hypothetical protein
MRLVAHPVMRENEVAGFVAGQESNILRFFGLQPLAFNFN